MVDPICAVRAATAQLRKLAETATHPSSLCRIVDKCESMRDKLDALEEQVDLTFKATRAAVETQRLELQLQPVTDPFVWQAAHIVDVEKQAASRRVASLNHVRAERRGADAPMLGCRAVEARAVCSDGRQRPAYVVELLDAGWQARTRFWHHFAAARELAAANAVPHALGWFDDHPGDDVRRPRGLRFVFERPRATPLRAALATARNERLTADYSRLTADSPLVRHWLREVATRVAEIETMSTHKLANRLDADSFWIAEHGAALRLGAVDWGDELTPNDLAPRARSLLGALAATADEILTVLCGHRANHDNCVRCFSDAKPIVVEPGETFDVALAPPPTGACWRYPLACKTDTLELSDAVPGACVAVDALARRARVRCVAGRPGHTAVPFHCVPMGAVDPVVSVTLRITVAAPSAVTGPLRPLLRCCRLLGTSSCCMESRDDDALDVDSLPALTPRALLDHPYFQPLSEPELVEAMAQYERLFRVSGGSGLENVKP